MASDAGDIYERILRAFLRRKADYFHPEYPNELLALRLRRVLPKLAFYCTENCILRPVFRGEYVCFEQILNFGRPSRREAQALVALGYRMAIENGCAILLKSFVAGRHRLVGDLSEQEVQFPLVNSTADDPWDAPNPPADVETIVQPLLGPLAEECEAHLSPLYGYVYFDEVEIDDAREVVERLSARSRVLHVSSGSRGQTEQLRRQLQARGAFVGEPRINYITTIPHRQILERLVSRAATAPIPCRILLEGQFHDRP